jgi:multidrug efflux pump subunit AcrB
MGLYIFTEMKRDLMPPFEFPMVRITATVPGASAIDMEKNVTFPIEEAIGSQAGIKEIRSTTTNSNSSIWVYFESDFTETQEALESMKSLIDGIKHRLPDSLDSISYRRVKNDKSWSLNFDLINADDGITEHRVWAKSLSDSISKIPGVVEVSSGQKAREVHIEFNRKKTLYYGVSIANIRAKIVDALRYTPVSAINRDEERISIELKKKFNDVNDIANIPIISNKSGVTVLLKDLAKVSFEFSNATTLYRYNGKKHIEFYAFKNITSDAINIRDEIQKVIDEYNKKLPKPLFAKITHNGPEFIERQLNVLKKNGLMGFIMVCVLLYLFLGFRVSVITAIGIPISYFGTFIVLYYLNVSIDLISVVGMILVIGIIVDDAIIVAEEYTQNLDKGQEPKDAALNAAHSTIKPVTGTILTTIVAFAPMIFVAGKMSALMYGIPCVVIAALTFSWIESFFVLPNHLQHFVKVPAKPIIGSIFVLILELYKKALRVCLKFRYVVLILLVGFMGVAIYIGKEKIKQNFRMHVSFERIRMVAALKESSSLEETHLKLKPFLDYLYSLPKDNIQHISLMVGRARLSNKYRQGNRFARIEIVIPMLISKPDEAKKEIKKLIEKELSKYKTDEFEELGFRVWKKDDEKDENIATIYVSGGDTLSFSELQGEIESAIKKVEGVEKVYIDEDRYQESWQFELDQKKATSYGFTSGNITSQLGEYFSKQKLTDIRLRGESLVIYTKFSKRENPTFESTKGIKIITPAGIAIPLSFIGKWTLKKTLKQISHLDMLRKFEVEVKFDEKKIRTQDISDRLDEALKPLKDKYLAYNFMVHDESGDDKKWSIKVGIIVVVLILLVLSLCLHSIVQPLLVAFAIPFGVIGVILALYFHGYELTMMAIIGLLGMAGVVVNDSLIMVDFINKISKRSIKFNREDIVEGASRRLRPIILTSVTTLGGVFPMAYGWFGESGFTQPLAFSLGWGLTFATFLTLIVIPALLEIWVDVKSGVFRFGRLLRIIK